MRPLLRFLSPLFAGALFGVGLVLGGMTQPAKVVGFLDVTGDWDPSLILVMGGAVMVYALLYRVFTKREAPLFATTFSLPTRKDLDARLLAGAALFGVGWGLGGFCPGPGLVSLGSGGGKAATFVVTMLAGMELKRRLDLVRARKTQEQAESRPELAGASS